MTQSQRNFKVGQKWKQRDGKVVEIAEMISNGNIFVGSAEIPRHRRHRYPNGRYYSTSYNCELDLIELVEDAPETSEVPRFTYKVGQIWEIGDGRQAEVTYLYDDGTCRVSVDGNISYSCGADGRTRFPQDLNRRLVKLVEDIVEPTTFDRLQNSMAQALHHARTEGTRYDSGKPRISLLPADAIREVAEVATFGADKYDAHNWMKGISYSRMMDSLLRHLTSFNSTDSDIDSESGRHHMAHVAWNAITLLHFILDCDTYGHLDDRPEKYRRSTSDTNK